MCCVHSCVLLLGHALDRLLAPSYACMDVHVCHTLHFKPPADRPYFLQTPQRHHIKQGPFGRKRRGRGRGANVHELAKLQDMKAYCEEQVS